MLSRDTFDIIWSLRIQWPKDHHHFLHLPQLCPHPRSAGKNFLLLIVEDFAMIFSQGGESEKSGETHLDVWKHQRIWCRNGANKTVQFIKMKGKWLSVLYDGSMFHLWQYSAVLQWDHLRIILLTSAHLI